ncbi:MAG: arabinogalactan endo-1,4-beta-galactosidase [Cyclobacteriaceae bacterium]|nr:arabinogalactan endo-1,4-beta-galactosidase [Cyclobacteriaceae bacterium]
MIIIKKAALFGGLILTISIFLQCEKESNIVSGKVTQEGLYFLGADLSYTNEMLDCGGTYLSNGNIVNPYKLFADSGANIVRVRLWHSPSWTNYSNFEDVKKTIQEAKSNNMSVLLDFHYSDTWADPGKQIIPQAWASITDLSILGDSIYNYTYKTLELLNTENLLPAIVQVGNEINSEILANAPASGSINWSRNSFLIKQGLQAVRDISSKTATPIQSMLHIAQPENAFWWFREATDNGITDYDWIGLSYYPKWSDFSITRLGLAINLLKTTYNKRVMIVETAYPHSLNNVDNANIILGQDALISGYPATPQGQREYMMDLTTALIDGGGEGVIYWEPTWISTGCSTLWGQGSHWENATFFDEKNNNEALPVFKFLDQSLY